jgi:hypothetical protein
MLGFDASFRIVGVISERRELKSSKNPSSEWRGYVLKVQGLGSTFEVNTDKELFERPSQPQEVLEFTGNVVMQGSMLKLECTSINRMTKEGRRETAAAG